MYISLIAIPLFISCIINTPYTPYISNLLSGYAIVCLIVILGHINTLKIPEDMIKFKKQVFNDDGTPKFLFYRMKINIWLLAVQVAACATIGWWWSFFTFGILAGLNWMVLDAVKKEM
jgi:hypothetical protein